jgi:TonB family protein
MCPSRLTCHVAAPVLVASLALGAGAQQAVPDTETYIEPRILERENPVYPGTAAMNRREGWVVLSYVVTTEGAVTEPMIEDSSGSEAFERAALRAVTSWKYSPATNNGQPVEHAMTKTRIQFQLEDGVDGVTPGAMRKFRQISSLMDEGKFAEAEPLVAELEFGERANLYEDAWFWWIKFVYLQKSGSTDEEEMRKSLRRAIGYQEEYLAPAQYVQAAHSLFVLDVRAKDVSSAIATFAKLRDAKAAMRRAENYAAAIEALTPTYEQLVQLVEGENVLVTRARIGEFDYWVHDLVRRSFSMVNIVGRLDVLDIRCERSTRRYNSIPADSTWTIPQSWGSCGVYIKGEQGTTFAFHEYPATAAAQPTNVPPSDLAPTQ